MTKKKYIDTITSITNKYCNTAKIKKKDNNAKKPYVDEDIFTNNLDDVTTKLLKVVENIDINNFLLPAKEFDLVICGGGFKGYYMAGVTEILKKMIDNDRIFIKNYTGSSIGAILAVHMICNVPIHNIRNAYEFSRKNSNFHDLNNIIARICKNTLPENAHELCNGKLRICVSELKFLGFKRIIIDKFEDKKHLLDVLRATSYVPFFTSNKMSGVVINGKTYYDGGVVPTPPINFNNELPQLLLETFKVEYPLKKIFNTTDEVPELLMLRGVIDMEKFIKYLSTNDIRIKKIPIKWLEPYQKNKKKYKNIRFFSLLIIGIMIFVYLCIIKIKGIKN
jgi:hypothetical protein